MKKLRYWLEFVFVSFFAWLIPLLPLPLLHGIAKLLGWIVYHIDRKSRAVALATLEAAFGEKYTAKQRELIARKSVQVFARSFLELFWTPRLNQENIDRYIRIADEEKFKNWFLLSKRGAIIVTLHFANFEWTAAQGGIRGYKGYVLMQRFKNDRLTPIFRRIREAAGQVSITQEKSMVRFFKALKRGAPVGILSDLTLKMSDPAVILRTFDGLHMHATMMPAALQQRTQCPVFPIFTLPEKGGYTFHVLDPIEYSPSASIQEISQACWDRWETLIREHPEQWLWSYKHWRYRAPFDSDRYPFYANRSDLFDAEFNQMSVGQQAAGENRPHLEEKLKP
jgi:Kdo2-lipid IVA lauroyltransferase/acyltransferase